LLAKIELCWNVRHGAVVSAIEIKQLTRRYGRRIGVEDVDLRVEEGELFGFLGPNGAGKTTTIRVMLGLLRADAGVVQIFGRDCWAQSAKVKEEVGYIPGDLRLYHWLTCRAALTLFGQARRRDLMAAGLELAEYFDLDPDVAAQSMSRGMRQKLGLILALAHRPKLLILDEPTGALDPLMQDKLYAHLRKLTGEGHTVFFSSHSLHEVELLCDRVVILRQGRVVADETIEALRGRARRGVMVEWKPDTDVVSVAVPFCLDVTAREDNRWHATLVGSIEEFVAWCAGQPIADLAIGQPDLNRLFRQFYADAGEQR
jgi:ABC-2 type transport system ATP-binding protein